MDKDRVREALDTLHAELADAHGIDEQSRAALVQVTDDIHRVLAGEKPQGGEPDDPLAGRLQEAVVEFGAEHPRISGAVNQVAAALANLGI